MKEMLHKHLENEGAFNGKLPDFLLDMTNSITGNVPQRMKLSIAVSEVVLFASMFSKHIQLEDKTKVPINAITFALASSGSSKDRTANGMRKCFNKGYEKIHDKRIAVAEARAIAIAAAEGGCDHPEEPRCWKQYYHAPADLFVATSTEEGLISHMNELEDDGLGAASLYVGELGSELQSNANIINNIRLYAELYDLGAKEVKKIKSKESQAKSVKLMAANGLFIGSHDNILYDDAVKQKFKLEFTTKLARRSFFTFTPEEIKSKAFDTVDEMIAYDLEEEQKAITNRIKVNALSGDIAKYNLSKGLKTPLVESEEAQKLFLTYKRYNEVVSDELSKLYPITKLVRKHAQWRALKLAGAFAIMSKHDRIEKEDYVNAISYVEMLDNDMIAFEEEFRKEAYEQFVDYMHFIADNGASEVTIHQLRKMGYIPTSGASDARIKELVKLAASLDSQGIYTIHPNSVHYEQTVTTTVTGVSYKPVTGTKAERAKQCADGFDHQDVSFADLPMLLNMDMAYSSFKFKDGERGKDNVQGKTKFVILDVDDSAIPDTDMHFILQGVNHHIVRTSDVNNAFKFRVLVELDSEVDVKDKLWKNFIQGIADHLSIKADNLPKSQIFFSYANRNILSVIDGEPLVAKDFVMAAYSNESSTPEPAKLPAKKQKELLDNPMETLWFAYECENGEGSRQLIRAAYYLKDLGATQEHAIQLLTEINNYWVVPLQEQRFQNTIISQIPKIWRK